MDDYSSQQPDNSLSVGAVLPQLASFDANLTLDEGTVLNQWSLVYETYGELNAKKDNAVLVCHALSGTHHAAGYPPDNPKDIGWWDNFIGPGKPIDTNRFFVVSPNNLGGCHGSTGPNSPHPDDGLPYGSRFPIVTVEDWVRSQALLADYLGIDKFFAVVGGSLGGMQALRWAMDYPTRLHTALIIAASTQLTATNIAFNEIARHAITHDGGFYAGDYYQHGAVPENGLSIARMIGHVTYLSNRLMSQKFGRERIGDNARQFNYDKEFQIESYLRYKGAKFSKSFDANTYLLMTKALDYFDPAAEAGGDLVRALSPICANCLVVSFSSDWRFPPEHSRVLTKALLSAKKNVSYIKVESPFGHDSFLLDNPIYHRAVRQYIDRQWAQLA